MSALPGNGNCSSAASIPRIDGMILFTFAGDQPKQQTIHDELPKPAHQVG
ncbi:MAG: hypothetical protein ABSB42_12555 [Tepidisphaeraceae bacterium]|jgi:hypothetical protein